jgi:DNA-binding NarL/FixJ family response regulator
VIRILIADDNQFVRQGVAAVLSGSKAVEVCGEAPNSEQTLLKAVELKPDLVLLDVSMPDRNGLETARLLQERAPQSKILILSQHDPDSLREASVEAGAVGCLDKARIVTELLPAIEKLFEV